MNSDNSAVWNNVFSQKKVEKDETRQASKNDIVMLGERKYPLNKSRSKFVVVGLTYEHGFVPGIKLTGIKNDTISFNENEWNHFLNYQGVISNYFYSNERYDAIHTDNFSIYFDEISSTKVIQIWKNNIYIYMGCETISKLWEFLPLVKHTVTLLRKQQFGNYFKVLQNELQNQLGDLYSNACNVLHSNDNFTSENIVIAIELLHVYPEIFEERCLRKE